ncbi:hypothetical protein BDF14DRAFT_1854002 [Spinellus fusiger]|nr:hypothetical protein BDF14DRAFT_1854002 [Spinellus fusiger]
MAIRFILLPLITALSLDYYYSWYVTVQHHTLLPYSCHLIGLFCVLVLCLSIVIVTHCHCE